MSEKEAKRPSPKKKGRAPKSRPEIEANDNAAFESEPHTNPGADLADLIVENASKDAQPAEPFRPAVNEVTLDGYTIQTNFDKNTKEFMGTVLEFPDLKSTGRSTKDVFEELHRKVQSYLQNIRKKGQPVPEPFFAKNYPEKIELSVSQGMYRRLDILSRLEKVPLDRLLGELLSVALEKRLEPYRVQERPHSPDRHERHENRQDRHERNENRGNTRNAQSGGNNPRHNNQQRRHGARSYHDTMDNRENFLEYVRNLEKGNIRKK